MFCNYETGKAIRRFFILLHYTDKAGHNLMLH